MAKDEVWMIRAGETGYLIDDFKRGCVAVGWPEIGDLSNLKGIAAIRDRYRKVYPEDSPGKVNNAAAVLNKFRWVVEPGSAVVTYDPTTRDYLMGTVKSDYSFQPNGIKDYPHVREVQWENQVGRDLLSVQSRNSLGSTLTLFAINPDVWADLQRTAKGQTGEVAEQDEEKEDLKLIREDTVVRAHELIKDRILSLSDEDLEELCAAILRAMGYGARVSPKGPDRGVDVFASPDGLGLEEPRIKAEVKHRRNTPMGSAEIRSFIGGLRAGDRGLYVSTGGFTREAKYEADRSAIPVTLLDLDELADVLVRNYDKFDPEGRALIPLMRVYWPVE